MKKIFILTILSILSLGFFPLEKVQALTVGPPKFEFSADPGDVLTGYINMRNETDSTETWYSSFETFTVRGEYGEPVFSGKREGAATWIKTDPSQVTLGPGERTTIPFTINVPKDADPGGHYVAIFLGTVPPEAGGTGVSVVSHMVILVILDVSGKVVVSGEVLNFQADKKVFNYLPASFIFKLKNTGTVHLKPQGDITIKNMFGKTTEILAVNQTGYNVLPNSEREFSVNWEPKDIIEKEGFWAGFLKERIDLKFGYYKALLNLEFGPEGKKETAQASLGFWILPWRILLLSILILAVILLVATKGIQKYNRWIIAKAKMRY